MKSSFVPMTERNNGRAAPDCAVCRATHVCRGAASQRAVHWVGTLCAGGTTLSVSSVHVHIMWSIFSSWGWEAVRYC
jgi:hypothetical protein